MAQGDVIKVDVLKGKPMRKQMRYEDLPLLPRVVAESVCETVYTGSEHSNSPSSSEVIRIEGQRRAMNLAARQEFFDLCDSRCRAAYEAKAIWFRKCIRSTTGPQQLRIWITHWLVSFLRDPEHFRASCQ